MRFLFDTALVFADFAAAYDRWSLSVANDSFSRLQLRDRRAYAGNRVIDHPLESNTD